MSPHEAEQQQEKWQRRRHGDSNKGVTAKGGGPIVAVAGPRVRSRKGDSAGRREILAMGTATK